jgi:hypothetical protein
MKNVSLISSHLKTDARVAFWSRAAIVWGVCTSLIAGIGLCLLFPSWYHMYQTRTMRDSAISAEETALKKNIEEGMLELERAKLLLKTLGTSHDNDMSVYFDRFKKIADERKDSITVSRFSYSADTGKILVSVSGMSTSRDSLVAFVRDIQKHGQLQGVELPVADLAGRNNTFPFTITGSVVQPVTSTP